MKVVVGLGIPGKEYQGTRHNVGFDVLAELGQRISAPKPKVKFEAVISEVQLAGEKVLLVAPMTYMNLSGRSVRQIVDFYKLNLAEILVICDDLNLPLGKIRLRSSGSAGGQRGLENILQQLGTQEIARLRIGIDAPAPGRETKAWVLSCFSPSDKPYVEIGVKQAADAAESWIRDGLLVTMNRYNGATDTAAEKKPRPQREQGSSQGSRSPP